MLFRLREDALRHVTRLLYLHRGSPSSTEYRRIFEGRSTTSGGLTDPPAGSIRRKEPDSECHEGKFTSDGD